jgi:hypothetical protein
VQPTYGPCWYLHKYGVYYFLLFVMRAHTWTWDWLILKPAFLYLLQHPFFQSEMSKRLALELLQKVSNPSHMFTELEADDDGVSK